MSEKILVPVLGESITEATVAKWLKNEGDTVEADEAIVELETDKVNLEVPSPIDGVLSAINSKDGETVEVGALLGVISQNGTQPSEKKIITKIELKVIEKLNVNFEVNYRYKINWTRPLGFEYNPLKLLHIDNNIQHVAMIYYINDTTGATNINCRQSLTGCCDPQMLMQ